MDIRITMGQAKPGQLEELARQWRELFGVKLQTMQGFRHGHFAGDRATDHVLGVTFWDGEPDHAVIRRYLQEFMAQAGHLVAGPPQVGVYEILAEV
ncbi:MAG TPA: hypothetical protein VH482_27630 [Thermomicrobiales bacterium]